MASTGKRRTKRAKVDKPKRNVPSTSIHPRGKPVGNTLYAPDVHDIARNAARMGGSKAQIARDIGISRQTLFLWIREKPEFAETMRECEDLALAWWEDQGRNALWAEKFNATAWIFQMKCRFRDEYTEVNRHEHTGKDGAPIEVNDATRMEEARRVAFALGRILERQRMKVIDGEAG